MPKALGVIVPAAILFSLAVGCSKIHHDRADIKPAAPVVDTLSNGLPVALATKSAEWVAMWRKSDPKFTVDSLIPSGRMSADIGRNVQPLGHSLVADIDSSILCEVMGERSPSGRYVLVADAYRALPDSEVYNPKGGEVDEAAVLIDYDRRTCDTFFFGGPEYTFDWCLWVDSTHFAVAGSGYDGKSGRYGFLDLYSMPENLMWGWVTRPAPAWEPYGDAVEERMKARCRAWKATRPRS